MVRHFYHYTSAYNWQKIKNPEAPISAFRGLLPMQRLITHEMVESANLPAKATKKVIYGFSENIHPAWLKPEAHTGKNLFQNFMESSLNEHDDVIVLKGTLTPDDDAHLIDRSFLYTTQPTSGIAVLKRSCSELNRAFWRSATPISAAPKNMIMQVPEIICFTPIPLARLQLIQIISYHKLMNAAYAAHGSNIRTLPTPTARLNM